jgi:flagellin
MLSLLTNVNSLISQNNLNTDEQFESQTIQQMSSGYRINKSGDDPSGLTIANEFRADATELTQGVNNINDAIGQLQIMDGGISNISNLLDQLKTLATQSASDAFTGDRTTLNSEFQSLLGEIDRQAQSIGLNWAGQYAQTMPVMVGGAGAATGSTIDIDLSGLAVDTRGLSLGGANGMTAVAGSADIGDASPTVTVAQIVANTANTGSEATPGFTEFSFTGPGFSDGNAIAIAVNLQNVTTLDGLTAAVNAAIQVAAAGSSAADEAFKTAGITASDANGMQLSFSSPDTPFQVAAGDQMANALMGNLKGTAGIPLATTVIGQATAAAGAPFTPTNVAVQIAGAGLASPVDLTLAPADTDTAAAIADLTSQVAGNAQLQAAGITLRGQPGGSLTFTCASGGTFSVEAAGDTANALGLGSFVANAGGGVDYTSISGYAYDPTTASGNAQLEFSIGGGTSIALPPIDLGSGTVTGSDIASALNDDFAKNPTLQAAGLTASFSNNNLTISSSNNTYFRVNPGGSDPTADVGFGTAGAPFTQDLTASAALSNAVDSSGATTVTPLPFQNLSYGNDDQTVIVSADDVDGNAQTATITLQNNNLARTGQTIDQAIVDINHQLQTSNNTTLEKIVAVKENVGGVESIGFLSSLNSFTVSVGNSVNGNGLNGGVAVSENSTLTGASVNVSVDTEANALAAVTAIDNAVNQLGAVQCVVGTGEDQLNYAMGLSQSQVTNYSAAESNIRDTDVAAGAANLTKSQIIEQATIAAMAQANTSIQAVLTLLKGD